MLRDDAPAVLLVELEAEQQRLCQLLAGRDEAALAERPANGKWSVAENVRHLLFAEQAHLDPLVPGGRAWSGLGLLPHNTRKQQRLRMAGTATTTVEDVLRAWPVVHELMRELAQQDTALVRKALAINLRHLGAHITVVERLLRVL